MLDILIALGVSVVLIAIIEYGILSAPSVKSAFRSLETWRTILRPKNLGVFLLTFASMFAIITRIQAEQLNATITDERDLYEHQRDSYAAMYLWCVEADNIRAILSIPRKIKSTLQSDDIRVDSLLTFTVVKHSSTDSSKHEVHQRRRIFGQTLRRNSFFPYANVSKGGHAENERSSAFLMTGDEDHENWEQLPIDTLQIRIPEECIPQFDSAVWWAYTVPLSDSGAFILQVNSVLNGWAPGFPPSLVGDDMDNFGRGVGLYRHTIVSEDTLLEAYQLSVGSDVVDSLHDYRDLFRSLAHHKETSLLILDTLPIWKPTDSLGRYWDLPNQSRESRPEAPCSFGTTLEIRDPIGFAGIIFVSDVFFPVAHKTTRGMNATSAELSSR